MAGGTAAAARLLALAGALAAGGAAAQPARNLTPEQESAVEALVSRWIAAHPGEIRRALDPVRAAGVEDPDDGVLGNPEGDVLVAAFLDRGGAPSAASLPILVALAASDPGVRVSLKELPLLSSGSVGAALAAFASRRQGDAAFRAFEAAMLGTPGPADAASARSAAEKAGLDLARLDADAASPAAMDYLRRVRSLASGFGIGAAPTFLVGGAALVGTRGLAELREAVRAARAGR